ncbi:hypothetical protein [Microtetraspora glauca]|uniref:Uncharacterized protein n=1 Tax=Microtetraspora glauca TaxID=1996 RepID=A0ABV3GQK4_MICGL
MPIVYRRWGGPGKEQAEGVVGRLAGVAPGTTVRLAGGQADPVPQPQRVAHGLAEVRARSDPGDAPDDLAEEEAEDVRGPCGPDARR